MLQTACNVPIKPFKTGVGTFCIICFMTYKVCGIHFSALVNESYISVLVSLEILYTVACCYTISYFYFPVSHLKC